MTRHGRSGTMYTAMEDPAVAQLTPLEPKFPVALVGYTGRLATVQGLAQEMHLPGGEALRFLAQLEKLSGIEIPVMEAGGYGWFHLFNIDAAVRRCLCPSLSDSEVHSLAESYKGLKREHIRQMLEEVFREARPARQKAKARRGPTQFGRPPQQFSPNEYGGPNNGDF